MKKITAILVCLLLVASIAVAAFAAEEVKYTLTADKTSVERGDTVTFTVSTNGIESCKALSVRFEYDKDVFEYVSGAGLNVPGGAVGSMSTANNELAYAMFTLGTTVSVSGDFCTLQMKVLNDAAFAESDFKIVEATYTAADNSVAVVQGSSVKMSVVCANHTPVTTTTKEATCKEAGTKVTSCSVCGEVINTETIAKLPHTEKTEVTKAATCKEAGQKVTSCSVCGEVIDTETIAKLPHTEKTEVTKAATCKEAGTKVTSCSVCGEVINTETIAKLPHTNETVVTKAATCSEAGEKTVTCTVCGESETIAIEKLAHTWDEGVLTKEMTCTEDGQVTYTCTVCDATEVVAIDKLPHDFDEGVVTKEATTKAEGEKSYTCKDCGATKTEAIAKLETPKTDDNSMILAFVLLMVLSAAGVAVTVIGKKRVA